MHGTPTLPRAYRAGSAGSAAQPGLQHALQQAPQGSSMADRDVADPQPCAPVGTAAMPSTCARACSLGPHHTAPMQALMHMPPR